MFACKEDNSVLINFQFIDFSNKLIRRESIVTRDLIKSSSENIEERDMAAHLWTFYRLSASAKQWKGFSLFVLIEWENLSESSPLEKIPERKRDWECLTNFMKLNHLELVANIRRTTKQQIRSGFTNFLLTNKENFHFSFRRSNLWHFLLRRVSWKSQWTRSRWMENPEKENLLFVWIERMTRGTV